jgi:hypothetical protein
MLLLMTLKAFLLYVIHGQSNKGLIRALRHVWAMFLG